MVPPQSTSIHWRHHRFSFCRESLEEVVETRLISPFLSRYPDLDPDQPRRSSLPLVERDNRESRNVGRLHNGGPIKKPRVRHCAYTAIVAEKRRITCSVASNILASGSCDSFEREPSVNVRIIALFASRLTLSTPSLLRRRVLLFREPVVRSFQVLRIKWHEKKRRRRRRKSFFLALHGGQRTRDIQLVFVCVCMRGTRCTRETSL